MNCTQNERKGAAKKKVRRLATVQASRNIRTQQQGRARRGVATGTKLRPLKGTAARASALPKRPAKAIGGKAVKPKLKAPQVDHDDSDTNSVASTSRAKRIPAKGKPEDAETPDKKAVKRTEDGGDGTPARKGRESTPTGSAEAAASKKKTSQVLSKLVAKNNTKKNKLTDQPSILKFFAPGNVSKQPAGALVQRTKSNAKWVVVARKGSEKTTSRRSQTLISDEARSDSPNPAKRPKGAPTAVKKKDEEEPAALEGAPMEVKEEEAEVKTAGTTDSAKKPPARKLSVSGVPRVTRSTGDKGRILRNGKSSKIKRIVQRADVRKSRKSKTDDDVKSPTSEDVDCKVEDDLEDKGEFQPEGGDSVQGATMEELTPPREEVPSHEEPEVLPEALKSAVQPEVEAEEAQVAESANMELPSFHPVSPFTPDGEVTRFSKGDEAEHVEPKAAVAVTTPLSPVSPVANSILSNKNFTDTNSNNVKENRKPTDGQPLKAVETIINDIHTDWDSDEDGQCSPRDAKVPFGNASPAQVTKENEAPKYNILNKAPSRQIVSTPPLIEPDKPKMEDKSDGSPSDSRNIGMKMPPTTECLLKTKEINGFADSVELLAKRSSKIDFELLRRRTKRSMSLNVDPNDKLSHGKRTYGPAKPREVRTLVSMPKLSPEVDLTSIKSPPKNVAQTDKLAPKSEELFDNLVARTKDEIKETDESRPQEMSPVKEDEFFGALNGTCDDENKKDISDGEIVWSTPNPSANPSPVPDVNLETDDPPSVSPPELETETNPSSVPPPELETQTNPSPVPPLDLETELNPSSVPPPELDTEADLPVSLPELETEKIASAFPPDLETEAAMEVPLNMEEDEEEEPKLDDGENSLCSEKRSDDFSLHITIDSAEDNSEDKHIDMETMDSETVDLPKDDEEDPPQQPELKHGENAVLSQDENSSEHPLSPPKLKPFDSDSLVDEEEIMAGMVDTPEEEDEEEPKTETVADVETSEPAGDEVPVGEKEPVESEKDKVVERKEEDNSNSSEVSASYIDNLLASQEDAHSTEEQSKTEVGDEPGKEETEILDESVTETVTGCQVMPPEGELTTPKDPERKSDVQPSARVDTKEPCGSSASSLSSILDADTTRLNLDLNIADIERKRREIFEEEESPEKRAIKEHVLNSLGLQSVRSVAEAAAISSSGTGRSAKRTQRKDSGGAGASSGRLKVVINVPKEKSKPLRMLFKNGKPYPSHPEAMPTLPLAAHVGAADEGDVDGKSSAANTYVEGNGTTDNALLLLSDYRANIGTLPEATTSNIDADGKNKQPGSLVIPEKSSSFSIHPGRLCSDVCSYCFGKFGSLDTPCHIAQLKSRDRQMKILAVETQLAMDSCLCDACIRYVDRKANCPSYKPPGGRREKNKYSGTQAVCCVNGCPQLAVHSLRKKWYFKIRKSVAIKCPVNLDLLNPQLPLPLCAEHYSYMDYFMVCGLCKRRLTRSHMYNLSEVREINLCLEADGIPARLSDKLFVCKLCRYYATMRVKHPRSHFTLTANQREFFNSYRKRILRNHDIAVSGSEDNGEGDPELPKDRSVSPAGEGSCNEEQPKGKRRRARSNTTPPTSIENNVVAELEAPKKKARTSAGSAPRSKDKVEQSDSVSDRTDADKVSDKAKNQPPIRLCLSNVTTNPQSGSAEWVRKDMPPFFPGEDQLALHANIQFQSDDVPSEQKDWERCTSTLQFDKETKRLWQELQRPYGSQSSFIRHLVLMERYWRQGELTLTATTDRAGSYTRSVQNRLTAYGTRFVSKKTPQVTTTVPPSAPNPAPQKPVAVQQKTTFPTNLEQKVAMPEKAVKVAVSASKPAVSPQRGSGGAPSPPAKVAVPRLPPKPQLPKSAQAKTSTPLKTPSKQQKILPKPPAPPTSAWEPIGKNVSANRPFFVTSTPVVNLTSSVSLTAVPVPSTVASPVPELLAVNSDPLSVARTSRPSSWNSSGGFVSIVPSSSTATAPVRVTTSPNLSASITPLFQSSSTITSPSTTVPPSLSPGGGLRVDGTAIGNQGNKSQHLVQVTAGGKSFSLTIAQFKKLQALRQQRQLDQQKKGRKPAGVGVSKPKPRRASTSSSVPEPATELVATDVQADVEPSSQEAFVPMICDVRSVTSSDQAITMWDEPDRTEECKLNPQLEITPIEPPPPPVLPKISKELTLTHVSSEMTLKTLVPSRALAAEPLASTPPQISATVTAPRPTTVSTMVPATVLVPTKSPSLIQGLAPSPLMNPVVAPVLTPPVSALPVMHSVSAIPPVPPIVEIIPAGGDFPPI